MGPTEDDDQARAERAAALAAIADAVILGEDDPTPWQPAPVARLGDLTVEVYGIAGGGQDGGQRLEGPGWEALHADGTALWIEARRMVVRRDGVGPWLEAARDGSGAWSISIEGIGPATPAGEVARILPALGAFREQLRQAGGRPRGSTKKTPADVAAALARYRKATGRRGLPPATWLADVLGVSLGTAENYLARDSSTKIRG